MSNTHCKCERCMDYVYPFKRCSSKCDICNRIVDYTMGYPPGNICDECWGDFLKELPKYITHTQVCRYVEMKIEKYKL